MDQVWSDMLTVPQNPLPKLLGVRSGVSVIYRHVPGFFMCLVPGIQEVLLAEGVLLTKKH